MFVYVKSFFPASKMYFDSCWKLYHAVYGIRQRVWPRLKIPRGKRRRRRRRRSNHTFDISPFLRSQGKKGALDCWIRWKEQNPANFHTSRLRRKGPLNLAGIIALFFMGRWKGYGRISPARFPRQFLPLCGFNARAKNKKKCGKTRKKGTRFQFRVPGYATLFERQAKFGGFFCSEKWSKMISLQQKQKQHPPLPAKKEITMKRTFKKRWDCIIQTCETRDHCGSLLLQISSSRLAFSSIKKKRPRYSYLFISKNDSGNQRPATTKNIRAFQYRCFFALMLSGRIKGRGD